MAYVKIIYQNSPSTATPINAENLNHMDDQIALNDQRLTEIETSYVKSFNGRKGEVVPEDGDYDIGQIAPLTGAQVGQVPVVTNIGTEEDPELVFRMGAGGGGGHSIIDSEGNTMPQESAMQFKGMTVTDDATNGKTVVEATKTSVGLGNVPNVTTDNQTPTVTEASTRANLATGDTLKTIIGKIKKFFTDLKAVAFTGLASDVTYSNTQSGLSADNVQGAIDELADRGSVSVTGDGIKTYRELLNELYALADLTKIKDTSYIFNPVLYSFNRFVSVVGWTNVTGGYNFSRVCANEAQIEISNYILHSTNSIFSRFVDGTPIDISLYTATNGEVITLYY